jgi:hypothetical protein
MFQVRSIAILLVSGLGLAACASSLSPEQREAREARINAYPDHYKADLAGAVHAYVADPTNIRGAYVAEPTIRTVGRQNRYVACLRFDAKNSDGRYIGSKDLAAVFVSGRFDQFLEQPPELAAEVREGCKQAEYQRFPEIEALKR